MPPLARRAQTVSKLHDFGYRLCWPPTIDRLTPRERRLLLLSDHADAYQQQEARAAEEEGRSNRPDNFGSVGKSRRDAFQ